MELFYRVGFCTIYGSFFLLRKRFAHQVQAVDPDVVSEEFRQEAVENEGKLSLFFRAALSLGMMSSLALYLWNPKFVRRFGEEYLQYRENRFIDTEVSSPFSIK